MYRYPLSLGHLHKPEGLFISPGFNRTAITVLFTMALLLANDHYLLGIHLTLHPAKNRCLGTDHCRINVGFLLAAELGIIFIYVLKDIFQRKAKGASNNTDPFHRGKMFLTTLLKKTDALLKTPDPLPQFIFRDIIKCFPDVFTFRLQT